MTMIRTDNAERENTVNRLKLRRKRLSGFRKVQSILDWLAGLDKPESDRGLAPVDRIINETDDKIANLLANGVGDLPIEPLFDLLKDYVEQPKKFRWHYLGTFQGSYSSAFCKHHGLDIAPVRRAIVGPQISQVVHLARYAVAQNGKRFSVYLGQCPDCGAIYWGTNGA